jgi:uncharacterized membrane protein YhaH (DUF805 family)
MELMLRPLRHYADFNGRSSRQEYWLFMLFKLMVYVVLWGIVIALIVGSGEFGKKTNPDEFPTGIILSFIPILLAWLVFFLPSLAVQVRRFHDQNQSGWMGLLNIPYYIPYLGTLAGIAILVFMCIEGTRGANQYGEDPLNPVRLGEVFQ